MFRLNDFLVSFASGATGGISMEYIQLLEGFVRVAEFAGEVITIADNDDDDNLDDDTADFDHHTRGMYPLSQRRTFDDAASASTVSVGGSPQPPDNELHMLFESFDDDDAEDPVNIMDMQRWIGGEDAVNPPVDTTGGVINWTCQICCGTHSLVYAVPCGHTYCYVCALKCLNSSKCYDCRAEFPDNSDVQQIFLRNNNIV